MSWHGAARQLQKRKIWRSPSEGSAVGRRGHAEAAKGFKAPQGLQAAFHFSRRRSPFARQELTSSNAHLAKTTKAA